MWMSLHNKKSPIAIRNIQSKSNWYKNRKSMFLTGEVLRTCNYKFEKGNMKGENEGRYDAKAVCKGELHTSEILEEVKSDEILNG